VRVCVETNRARYPTAETRDKRSDDNDFAFAVRSGGFGSRSHVRSIRPGNGSDSASGPRESTTFTGRRNTNTTRRRGLNARRGSSESVVVVILTYKPGDVESGERRVAEFRVPFPVPIADARRSFRFISSRDPSAYEYVWCVIRPATHEYYRARETVMLLSYRKHFTFGNPNRKCVLFIFFP